MLDLTGTSYFCTYYAIRLSRLVRSGVLTYSPVIRDARFVMPLAGANNDYFPGNKKTFIEKFGNCSRNFDRVLVGFLRVCPGSGMAPAMNY